MRLLFSVLITFMSLALAGVWLTKTVTNSIPVDLSKSSPSISQPIVLEESSSPFVEDAIVEEVSPEVLFSSYKTMPGEILSITLSGFQQSDSIDVQNPFDTAVSFYEHEDKLVALLPIKYSVVPGDYTLTLSSGDFSEDFLITVEYKEFTTQDIVVDDTITSDTVDNSAANAEYSTKIQPLKYKTNDKILWDGTFIEPVQNYRLTSDFGEIRTVNQKPSGRHGGIDLAVPTGTPIIATNNGEVLFADNIQLTGNTVIVDHGLGLKSYYYHMDSLAVETGDLVEKNDPIGTVGMTGFSTGPHLHYAMSIGTIYINPWSMFSDNISFS